MLKNNRLSWIKRGRVGRISLTLPILPLAILLILLFFLSVISKSSFNKAPLGCCLELFCFSFRIPDF